MNEAEKHINEGNFERYNYTTADFPMASVVISRYHCVVIVVDDGALPLAEAITTAITFGLEVHSVIYNARQNSYIVIGTRS